MDGLPALVAVTLRTDEPALDATLLADLVFNATGPALRPAPLGEAAVATLVRDALGESATLGFCRACHDHGVLRVEPGERGRVPEAHAFAEHRDRLHESASRPAAAGAAARQPVRLPRGRTVASPTL